MTRSLASGCGGPCVSDLFSASKLKFKFTVDAIEIGAIVFVKGLVRIRLFYLRVRALFESSFLHKDCSIVLAGLCIAARSEFPPVRTAEFESPNDAVLPQRLFEGRSGPGPGTESAVCTFWYPAPFI